MRTVTAIAATALLAACGASTNPRSEPDATVRRLVRYEPEPMPEPVDDGSPGAGRVLVREAAAGAPYRLTHQPAYLLSDYWDCRGRRRHRGVDLAGQGELAGLGTPVVAIGRARVIEWGTPATDPERFGRPLTHAEQVERGGRSLPASAELAPYGRVFFFTEDYGAWHSGATVVTELIEGPLRGHIVRYMHLGAVHPDVRGGGVVERGQEIGVLGGTAVQRSTPHVHLDIEDTRGQRVDPAPYLGLPVRDGGERCP